MSTARARTTESVPSSVPPSAPSAADERRLARRRSARPDRALNPPGRTARRPSWLPRRWPHLILGLVSGIGICALVSPQVPSAVTAAALALAVAGALGLRLAKRLERGRDPAVRTAAAFSVVVVPLFLFGLGIARWAVHEGLPWEAALATLLCVSSIAGAYLRRQPSAIFAAQLAIWSACVVATGSVPGAMTLLIALCIAVIVNRDQLREQGEEDEQRRAGERVRTRARDILTDYEETRQGWFWETDRRSLLTYISPPIAEALGYSAERLIGQPLVGLFDLGGTGADAGLDSERTLLFHLSVRSPFQELAVRAAIAGEERWWSVSGRPIYDEFDNFVGFRGSGTDLTEKKRSQEHASRLARYDSLTGLANRFQMAQTLEKILAAPQEMHRACSLLLLDLDRFKHVNDTLGHPAGDALLVQVAQRLLRAVGERGQVGRVGGDEFQVISAGNIERSHLGDLARDIIHSLSQPYLIDGHCVVIGASIGIAVSPEDGLTSEALVRNADLALYAAKDAGRGRHHFYAHDLHAEAEARAALEQALLRWHHPARGWISPEKFVRIAEDTGLITQIGEWALRAACRDLATWPEEVRCAVNVSPLQFANPQLPAIVTHAIAQAGIDPARLELEITESVFLNDDEGTDAMFAALKRVGVRLALDDFGTGYSSLGYLKKAPFDKIKIDQSFVRGATEPGSRNGAIIASITSLAHALGMDTTAEGVETFDELDLVRVHGCSHIQGFIYERALDAQSVLRRLEEGLAAVAHGPRSARSPRQTMLRKVVLEHGGHSYDATIRNISRTGALVEGLWDVHAGTTFRLHMPDRRAIGVVVRWCSGGKAGVAFEEGPAEAGASAVEPASSSSKLRMDRRRAPLLKQAG
ncbi:MAG: diguanylate cyclase [Sphingomonadales bacterium 32-68-7]|nr:MAG: diguanylate cyclase [Sphingomonadales bacterium 32-68-7]